MKVADTGLRARLELVYKELGSETRLREVLKRFYDKMAQDTMVGFFFHNKDLDAVIDGQKAFLLRAMGVTTEYRGRSPKAAHENLPPILSGHFDRRHVLLKETLQEFSLSSQATSAWLDFELQFRDSIVEK